MSKRLSEKQIQEFREISRLYSDSSIIMHEAISRKAGLSGTDHKYLGVIIQKGELTAGELSKLTGLTTGAITGLIDRLEKKKLVKRQFDKTDRRKIIIVANVANAMRLLTPLFTELQEKSEKLITSLTLDELAAVKKYFQSAIEIMIDVTNNINNK